MTSLELYLHSEKVVLLPTMNGRLLYFAELISKEYEHILKSCLEFKPFYNNNYVVNTLRIKAETNDFSMLEENCNTNRNNNIFINNVVKFCKELGNLEIE